MKSIKANVTRGLPVGALVPTSDNSGAKIIKIFTVVGLKTVKGRKPAAGVADLVMGSVVRGKPEMRKQVVHAVIIRQKKEYQRPDGSRIKFEDNAAVVLKDDKGNPKGTMIKGAVAKEVTQRWPAVAKISTIVV